MSVESSYIIESVIGNEDVRSSHLQADISPYVSNERVMQAFLQVDRMPFSPKKNRHLAYQDQIVPIDGATISQPSLVAKMVNMLEPSGSGVVLEIGTGSGFLAAVLSNCYSQVHTVDVSEELSRKAKYRLRGLGYKNITTHVGDGVLGIPGQKFDGIIVTAGASTIPHSLIDQLQEGCPIVLPVGEDPEEARLILGIKREGKLLTRSIGSVYFMPLISEHEGGFTKEQLTRVAEKRNEKFAGLVEIIAQKINMPVEELQSKAREQLIQMGDSSDLSIEEINRVLVKSFRTTDLI